MPRKARRSYSATDKVAILRHHLLDHVPVSDICDQHQIQPTLFYRWQRQFFENGTAAFSSPSSRPDVSPLGAENAAPDICPRGPRLLARVLPGGGATASRRGP